MKANSWQIIAPSFAPLKLESGKEGKKLQKIEYLENEKSFLDEIKSVFLSFQRAIISWKNKITDTCFKNLLKQVRLCQS